MKASKSFTHRAAGCGVSSFALFGVIQQAAAAVAASQVFLIEVAAFATFS